MAVGDAGATDVTTGVDVDSVTGGVGSTASCVCGGASTLGAAGSTGGAFGGAACDGASVSSGACAFGSGAGTVVVTT